MRGATFDEQLDAEAYDDGPTAEELFEKARDAIRALHLIDKSQNPLSYMRRAKEELDTVIEATEMGSTLISALIRRSKQP